MIQVKIEGSEPLESKVWLVLCFISQATISKQQTEWVVYPYNRSFLAGLPNIRSAARYDKFRVAAMHRKFVIAGFRDRGGA